MRRTKAGEWNMDSLHNAFESEIRSLSSVPRLVEEIILRKAREAGVQFTAKQRRRLTGTLKKRTSDFDGLLTLPGPALNIKITDEDVGKCEERLRTILDGVPAAFETISDSRSTEILQALEKKWRRESRRQDREMAGFRRRLRRTWIVPLSLLELHVHLAYEIGDGISRATRSAGSCANPHLAEVLARLHARACQVASEVCVLLGHGFADGAMARWRTLHEMTVTAVFILSAGDGMAERYLAHGQVEAYKAATQYQAHAKALGCAPLSENELDRVREARDEVIARFGKAFASDYGWASESLRNSEPKFIDIERAVGVDCLRPYYKLASQQVHATPRGLLFKLGLLRDEALLAGPSNLGLADPGQHTALSLTQITATLTPLHATLDSIIAVKVLTQLSAKIETSFVDVDRAILEALK
ncbi:MAG: hypothetical protein HY049_17850 [Acidobacteria bacterium]|nr:hypothetical protein [Acidobacteriota bacterium]